MKSQHLRNLKIMQLNAKEQLILGGETWLWVRGDHTGLWMKSGTPPVRKAQRPQNLHPRSPK